MKLKGRVALITGGTSGIGEAAALLFAREGAKVAVASRGSAGDGVVKRIKEAGGEAIFIKADVSKADDIRRMVDAHAAAFGRLDIVFNNASYEGPGKAIVDTPEDELDRVIETNLKSVFLTCKYAVPLMIASGGGSIINTTAASAHEGLAWPNLGAYIASKGGVISLTRVLAIELAGHKIRANSLNPGIVRTPMLESFAAKQADPDGFWNALSQEQLLKRLGRPEELAAAALFLASDDSSFVTGTDMVVDGGLILG